jgi:hypothetical protein
LLSLPHLSDFLILEFPLLSQSLFFSYFKSFKFPTQCTMLSSLIKLT